MQYVNRDIYPWPQKVHVTWEKVIETDDSDDRPDERDDFFWPNPEDYQDAAEFDEQMAKAQARMTAWKRREWEYVGVIAKATIYIPIGGKSFRVMTLQSAGLWGIESDAGEYLDKVFHDEKENLRRELASLGKALAADDYIDNNA